MNPLLRDEALLLQLAEKGMSYAALGIEWKPDLHPRDHHGRFTFKGHGIFNMLSDIKSGNFADGVAHEGDAGYKTAGELFGLTGEPADHEVRKVGGVVITPPENLGYQYSEHHIDWALKPGEKAYAVYGGHKFKGQTGVIVHHADGSATALMPTPEGEYPKVTKNEDHFSELSNSLTAAGYTIDTDNPLDQNEHDVASKYDESVAELEQAKEMGAAPQSAYGAVHTADGATSEVSPGETPGQEESPGEQVGKTVQVILHEQTGEKLGHVEQTPEGKFTSHDAQGNKIGNISKHLHTAIEKVKSGKLTTPSSYTHKKAAKADTAEKAATPSAPSADHFQDIQDEAGNHIGHITKTPEGKFVSHDAEGNKIGNVAKHLPTAVQKVHDKHAENKALGKVADKAHKEEPKVEEPKEYGAKSHVGEAEHPMGHVAKHNATGEWHSFDAEGNQIGSHGTVVDAIAAVSDHHDAIASGDKQMLKDESGKAVGHIEKVDGKWASYDADGNKIGYTISNVHTAIDKVYTKANAAKPVEADKKDAAKLEEAMNEPKPKVPGTKTFTAPNGSTMDVPPGSKLYKEKGAYTSPNYAMFDANGEYEGVFVSSTGNYIPKEQGQAHLAQSWTTSLNQNDLSVAFDNSVTSTAAPKSANIKPIDTTPGTPVKEEGFSGLPEGTVIHHKGVGTEYVKEGEGWTDGNHTYSNHDFSHGLEYGSFLHGHFGGTETKPSFEPKDGEKVANLDELKNAPVGTKMTLVTKDHLSDTVYHKVDNNEWESADGMLSAPSGDFNHLIVNDHAHLEWGEKKSVSTVQPMPAETAKAVKKPAKAKTDDPAELPTSVEMPNGNKLVAEPGGSVVKNPETGELMKLDSANNAVMYNADGSKKYGSDGKISSAKAKKLGFTQKVADGGAQFDFASPPQKEWSGYELYGASHAADYTDYGIAYNAVWGNHTFKQHPGSAEAGEKIAQAISDVMHIKDTYGEQMSKGAKIKTTKSLNKLNEAWKMHLLAAKLDDPDFKVTPAVEKAADDIKTFADKNSLSWVYNNKIAPKLEDKKFQQSLGDLGFDLATGSHEEFSNYALSQGAQFVGGMSPDDVKNWVYKHVGKPGSSGISKENIEKLAQVNLSFKDVAAKNEQVEAKKKALAKASEPDAATKAAIKKADNEVKIANSLHNSYVNDNGDTITLSLKNTAFAYTPKDGETTYIAPSAVKDKLAEDKSFKPSEHAFQINNLPANKAARLKSKYGIADHEAFYDNDTLDKVLQGEGAHGINHMSQTEKASWLVHHLIGDNVGKYNIEKKWTPENLLVDHPGNPATPSGKASAEALSNYLAAHDLGVEEADKYKLAELFNLDQANEAADGPFGPLGLIAAWKTAHKDLPEPSINQSGGTTPQLQYKLAEKPDTISQEAWDVSGGAEAGGKELAALIGEYATMHSDEIQSKLADSMQGSDAKTQILMANAPEGIKRLYVWAEHKYYATNYPEDAKYSAIKNAILARARAGEYITNESTLATINGKTIAVPPGYGLYKENGVESLPYHILAPLEGGGVSVGTSNGKDFYTSYEDPQSLKDTHTLVAKNPVKLDYKKASGEGQSFSEPALAKVDAAEAKKAWTSYSNEKTAPFYFGKALKNVTGGEQFASLTPQLHQFPVGVKQLALESAQNGDTDTLSAILWRAAKGQYDAVPGNDSHPNIDPNASYAHQIAKGRVSADDIENFWSPKEMDDFGTDFGHYSPTSISNHIAGMNTPTEVKKLDPNDFKNLAFYKTDESYGGAHTKQGYTDDLGREWLGKFYKSDPNSKYRIDAESGANEIGRLFGFGSAQSFGDTIDGKYTLMQHIEGKHAEIGTKDISELNEDQLKSAMQEQVLDWMVGNHDSHDRNLLLLPDGRSVLGIDKGQAFKFIGKDELTPTYNPNASYGEEVWYNRAFKAMQSGKIDEATAHKTALSVLLKAHQVQNSNDEKYEDLVNKALAARNFWPNEYPTRESFVQALMDRKHNLVSDFEKLYKGVFEKAGYKWDIDTSQFGKNINGASVDNSPQFAEDVKNAGADGKALILNSPDLEDHHILFTHATQSNGKDALLATAKLNKDADKQVTQYAEKLVSGHQVPTETPSHAQVAVGDKATIPFVNDQFFPALQSYAKTVSHHAEDKEYNQNTVSVAKSMAAQADSYWKAIDDAQAADPTKVTPHSAAFPFHLATLEQQDYFKQALSDKMSEYLAIKAAHDAGQSLKEYYPNFEHFQPHPTYVPSEGLTDNDQAEVAKKYLLSSGEHAVKTTDGGHYFESADGKDKTYATAQDFNNAASQPGSQWVPVSAKDAPYWESTDGQKITQMTNGSWVMKNHQGVETSMTPQQVSQYVETAPNGYWNFNSSEKEKSVVVQTSSGELKVTKRNAVGHRFQYNPATGKMEQASNAPIQNNKMHKGVEYTFESGNTLIHYRPWNGAGVTRGQQGLVSVEVSDWDNGHDGIGNVLDMLHKVGVRFSPSDEQSLELGYWRQMTNIVKRHNDAGKGNQKKMLDAVKDSLSANPHMTEAEELQMLKKAWTDHMGVDTDKVDHLPHFHEHNKSEVEGTGRPIWYRPDYSLQDLKQHYKPNTLPSHTMCISDANDYVKEAENRSISILSSGKLLSTEERLRLLNPSGSKSASGVTSVAGTSSLEDQANGASSFLFTRQNLPVGSSVSAQSPVFLLDPRTALRHTNYSFNYDAWGKLDNRASDSPYDAKTVYGQSNQSNELDIKNEAPVAFAIFSDNAQRDKIIQRLRDAGHDTLNGRALEDSIFSAQQWESEKATRIAKLWEELNHKEAE